MRVAVAGGTGLTGRHVVAGLAAAGHDPVVLARSEGVDLVAGTGLDEALAGVSTVIDVSDLKTTRRRASAAFFTAASQNLLAAGQRAGVRHHVVLSIVGIDRVDVGYYEGKRRQEELVLAGPVPGSVLRATQFHEFAGQFLDRTPGPVAVVPMMRIQPIAAREVAAALIVIAAGQPAGLVPELAGPREESLPDLARQLIRARGKHRLVVPILLPGAVGRACAGGALLPARPGPRGMQVFAQWLAEEGGGAAGRA
jgi:uncharacterized protein YbjT (DUF2867 family)